MRVPRMLSRLALMIMACSESFVGGTVLNEAVGEKKVADNDNERLLSKNAT